MTDRAGGRANLEVDLDIRPVSIGIDGNMTGQKLIQSAGIIQAAGIALRPDGVSVSAIQPKASKSSSSTNTPADSQAHQERCDQLIC